jgi:alpha-tubulin suppressor-like RCC1 family protein
MLTHLLVVLVLIIQASLTLCQLPNGVQSTHVYEWGGQNSFSIPFEIDVTTTSFKQIGFGCKHTVLLTSDGRVFTIGSNEFGQLGDSTFIAKTSPVQILQGINIIQIAVGCDFSIALTSDNTLYTWGLNQFGYCADGTTTNRETPVSVDMSFLNGKTIAKIAAGYYHGTVLTNDGVVFSWGRNENGLLGDSTTEDRFYPVPLYMAGALSGKTIRQISAKYKHTVALASDDRVYCWGEGIVGQLGQNTLANSPLPVLSLLDKVVIQVTAGHYHTIAVTGDNMAYCWGYNGYGACADGTTTNSAVPKAMVLNSLNNQRITQISAGQYHTTILTDTGIVYSVGLNKYSQLSDGTLSDTLQPVVSVMVKSIVMKSIFTGAMSTAFLNNDGRLYAFGMVPGYPQSSLYPIRITVPGDNILGDVFIASISAGATHTAAITNTRKLWCWGDNLSGQLGVST